MKKKNYVGKAVMLGALLAPIGLPTVSVLADGFYQNQTSAHAADITNWIASTPQQITNNLTTQNINPQQLDGQKYVIQWGDTLWGISQATGISIEKLAYDNNIQNIDLIFAGDVLILKRDGDVPAGYHVTGNGHRCAHSKIVINNYYGEDTERTALYRQGETAKDEDIANGPKDGARTEANAKALAEKIYDTLNKGGKMSELIKAKYAQIKVTYKGDKWTFNVDVYKEKESSSSSTETSSESKASSSDDSQTETRMSSSSSSRTETDSEANSSDLTGDE